MDCFGFQPGSTLATRTRASEPSTTVVQGGTFPDDIGYAASRNAASAGISTAGFSGVELAPAATSNPPNAATIIALPNTPNADTTLAAAPVARLVTIHFEVWDGAISFANGPNQWRIFERITAFVNGVQVRQVPFQHGSHTVATGVSAVGIGSVMVTWSFFVPAGQTVRGLIETQYFTPGFTAGAAHSINIGTRAIWFSAVEADA